MTLNIAWIAIPTAAVAEAAPRYQSDKLDRGEGRDKQDRDERRDNQNRYGKDGHRDRDNRHDKGDGQREKEYRRAIRAEKERHESEMRSIRRRYRSHPHYKRERALKREKERHAKEMRRIEQWYHHSNHR